MMNEVSTPLLNSNNQQHPATADTVTSLVVTSPLAQSVRNVPLSSGLDLPRGFLQGDHALALLAPDGTRVELQSTPLAHWSDGSVKWTLLDFVAPEVSPEASAWRIDRTARSGASMADASVTLSAETIGLRLENDSIVLRRGRTGNAT